MKPRRDEGTRCASDSMTVAEMCEWYDNDGYPPITPEQEIEARLEAEALWFGIAREVELEKAATNG